ncbi:MAG TPA: cyclic nucleotide-binding domain-containing protein, partial [Spirochaetota bacterium]|nr:cyclic nucleotide-binding domain-containing protein [Spirochaetota bacterium]
EDGFIFGIIQCITGVSDNETVQALTDCEILVIPKEKIEELYNEHPKIILKILSEYSEILRKLDKDLVKIDFFSSTDKREDRVFEIARKYVSIKEYKKAASLLKSYSFEIKDNEKELARTNALLQKLPGVDIVDVIETDQLISYKTLQPNSVIFTEYELADNFFIIKSGKVKITKLKGDEETLLAILGEGDIFGEMAILNDKPRNATASVEEETTLMIVDKRGINKLPPSLFVKILFYLTRRIWMVQQQIICSNIYNAAGQIYYLLTSKLKLAGVDQKRDSEKSYTFNFPLKELYQMLDINPQKKAEELSDFLKDNNLEFFEDCIKIRKIGALYGKNSFYLTRG